jgi:hypothetical protein
VQRPCLLKDDLPCRKYTEAIDWYDKALGLCPRSASTYAALGYTHHLMVRYQNKPSQSFMSPLPIQDERIAEDDICSFNASH